MRGRQVRAAGVGWVWDWFMIGRGFSLGEQACNFTEHFGIVKEVLDDGSGRAGGGTGAAAFAERLVDDSLLLGFVESDGGVRAEGHAGFATRTIVFKDGGGVG